MNTSLLCRRARQRTVEPNRLARAPYHWLFAVLSCCVALLESSRSWGACPAPAPPPPEGRGLLATYYKDKELSAPSAVRIEAVDFQWGTGDPANGVGPDLFSVRWTGQVVPRYTDLYTFYTLGDDGVRLWVDGVLLVDNWTDHPPTENSGQIALVAGQAYSIQMDYYENRGGATARLSWSSECQAKEPIPAEQLIPPATMTCPSTGNLAFQSDFQQGVPRGMHLFGMAQVASGYLQLTPADFGQYGIAVIDDFSQGRRVEGFHATFKAALFGACCPGAVYPADGFSFNLVPYATVSPVPGYGDPAEEGMSTGLAVCFDTFNNGGVDGPEINVKWLGQVVARRSFQPSQSPNGAPDAASAARSVVIDLETDGSLSVWYGGTIIFSRLPTPYNAALIGIPKWVFGARTGAAYENQWLDDLSISLRARRTFPVPGLFNTGVDGQGQPLADNARDLHYSLVHNPVPSFTFAATASGGFPIPPWLGDNSSSAWISPTGDTMANPSLWGNTEYIYETHFDLTGYDTNLVVIRGQWAADNEGLDILINNISTGYMNSGYNGPAGNIPSFASWQPFIVSSGFAPGRNTLTFRTWNAGNTPNPTGLRVEMCGEIQDWPIYTLIIPRDPDIVVAWAGRDRMLQTSSSVLGPWSDLSPGTSTNGLNYEVVVPRSRPAQFFRLRRLTNPGGAPDPAAAVQLLQSMLAIPGVDEELPVPTPELGMFDPMAVLGEAGPVAQAWTFHFGGENPQDVVVSADGATVLAIIQKGQENAFANVTTPRYILDEVTGVPRLVAFQPPLTLPSSGSGSAGDIALEFFTQFPWMFGTGDVPQQLQVSRVEESLNLGQHVVLSQIYGGYLVWGCELRVHLDSQNAIRSISGRYEREPYVDLDATLTEQQALSAAMPHWVAATGTDSLGPDQKIDPHGLVIFPTRLMDPSTTNSLTWWFSFPDAERFISAHTGALVASLRRENNLRMIYDRKNEWEGWAVFNADLQLLDGLRTTSSSLNAESPVADTAVADVESFWRNNFGRVGWNNLGAPSIAIVNANFDNPFTTKTELPNAKWNGAYTVYSPGFAAPDVVAHEMTHALVQARAGLVNAFEPGALNESFADVFGKLIEPGAQPWVMSVVNRDLRFPAVNHYKRLILSPNTPASDEGAVHANSGIGSLAAVLVADGDGSSTHPGLSRELLARIWWETLPRLSPWSTYVDFMLNAIDVTGELAEKHQGGVPVTGSVRPPRLFTSADAAEVEWAFRQVGLDRQYSSGWFSLPANKTTLVTFYPGESTAAGQTVGNVRVRFHLDGLPSAQGFIGELDVKAGLVSAAFRAGIVNANITRHGVGSTDMQVDVLVTTANYSRIGASCTVEPIGQAATPTPTPQRHYTRSITHWCDLPFCGRKYGDIDNQGLSLPAGCTVTGVQLELLDRNGTILGTTRQGELPAVKRDGLGLGFGAEIVAASTGGSALEVRVRSWHDAGYAVRYRLVYSIAGANCPLPDMTVQEVGVDNLGMP